MKLTNAIFTLLRCLFCIRRPGTDTGSARTEARARRCSRHSRQLRRGQGRRLYVARCAQRYNNGKPVRNAKTWYAKRRPEIEQIFLTQQFGRDPGRPADERFEVSDDGTPALNGKAIRKQITIRFSEDDSWPKIHLLVYLPATRKKPVPMFLSINFGAVQNAVDDPGITPEKVWDPRTNTQVPAATRDVASAASTSSRCWTPVLELPPSTTATSIPILPRIQNGIRARYLNPARQIGRQAIGVHRRMGLGHEPRGGLL